MNDALLEMLIDGSAAMNLKNVTMYYIDHDHDPKMQFKSHNENINQIIQKH